MELAVVELITGVGVGPEPAGPDGDEAGLQPIQLSAATRATPVRLTTGMTRSLVWLMNCSVQPRTLPREHQYG